MGVGTKGSFYFSEQNGFHQYYFFYRDAALYQTLRQFLRVRVLPETCNRERTELFDVSEPTLQVAPFGKKETRGSGRGGTEKTPVQLLLQLLWVFVL